MSSSHRAAWRRAARTKPKPPVNPPREDRFSHKKQAYLAAIERLPDHLSSPAAKLPIWSPLVIQTVRRFINKTRWVDDFEAELRNHPGMPSNLRSDALLMSLILENWNTCSYLRTNGVAALSWLPDDVLHGPAPSALTRPSTPPRTAPQVPGTTPLPLHIRIGPQHTLQPSLGSRF